MLIFINFSGYHMYCCSPPLSKAPEGDWRCKLCCAQFGELQSWCFRSSLVSIFVFKSLYVFACSIPCISICCISVFILFVRNQISIYVFVNRLSTITRFSFRISLYSCCKRKDEFAFLVEILFNYDDDFKINMRTIFTRPWLVSQSQCRLHSIQSDIYTLAVYFLLLIYTFKWKDKSISVLVLSHVYLQTVVRLLVKG